jgi:patatin-related protein
MAYQREVRLGLVLYGGVSLAVYENGIAQELYRAIAGQGVYGLIAKLIDSDIVIDVISGTSAGGVNGVMLAYALANGRQFAPSADLWRDQGDIQALLRKQHDANGSSILDSDYYQKKLANCFQDGLASIPNGEAPQIGELDLFVTSTDANGRISTVFDDLGHAIDIKNHRALFKLQYRNTRKNDLDAPAADLAQLSRMTSCFPVAFEPVTVARTQKNFFRWGKLRDPAVFLDGGILNNKPFTSTFEAIAGRTATREVERFLIYVEPSPETFAPSSAHPPAPTMTQAALSSLVPIPGYQSIAADLEAIEAHNERAAGLSQILESLPDAPRTEPDCLKEAGVLEAEREDCDQTAYITARLMQLRDTVVESILNDENGRGYFPSQQAKSAMAGQRAPDGSSPQPVPQQDARRSGRILVESFDAWPGDWRPTLTRYDVFFRVRRARHLASTLMRAAKAELTVPYIAWELVNHYFKLYEMMQWALVSWITRWNLDWKSLSSSYPLLDTQPKDIRKEVLAAISLSVWAQVDSRLQELLHCGIPVPSASVILNAEDASPAEPLDSEAQARRDAGSSSREVFHQQLTSWLDGAHTIASGEVSLLDAIDDAFKSSLLELEQSDDEATVAIANRLGDEFCRFLEIDRQLFLLQFGSGFESTELIRVVRFSPLDAQRCLSKGSVEDKVRGSALGAFGGFFKKGWRANDIMVGRLDAACLLVECLLTKQRLAALGPRRNAQPVSVTAPELQQYFPNLGNKAAGLEALINSYLSSPSAATDVEWNRLIDQIVCACHDEIQREEWPVVVACSIEQEYSWGRYRNNPKIPADPFDRKNLVWNRAKARPDQVLVQVAKEAIAGKMIPPFAPGVEAGGSFLEEIPDTVLDELGALAAIRVGKGLLASIPNDTLRAKVAGSAAFKLPFSWIAPLFYNWARMRRTQPDTVIIFNTAVPVFCLTLLALDVLLAFMKANLAGGQWALVVGVPLVLLVVWGWFFRR